ncbi:sel1l adaptor subunit of erad e3 ubiquitin ligase [Anaeramoeba ignava]|uniref:Sel1l adaptor subunit of erad e3 ubiquitin ligase n=1 Tax=Anaeramoeba ignava TaxID=1746090 RepID=A0A9Q0REI0_ANAIG|nr:sel1l adaptor subunit of erad e3 ubiquitin ligase [Anaeramoeba ignava]
MIPILNYKTAQSENSITIVLIVPENTNQEDLVIEIKPKTICVGLKNKNSLIEGVLYDEIEKHDFTFENKRYLNIIMEKKNPISWPIIIKEPNNGKIDSHSAFLLYALNEEKENYKEAFKYLEISSEKKHFISVHRLATFYSLGSEEYNIKPDAKKALDLWTTSAEMGNPEAQHLVYFSKLNQSFFKGNGIEKDLKKAVLYWNEAAEDEHPEALFNLGILYLNGNGVETNPEKALVLIQKAKELDPQLEIPEEIKKLMNNKKISEIENLESIQKVQEIDKKQEIEKKEKVQEIEKKEKKQIDKKEESKSNTTKYIIIGGIAILVAGIAYFKFRKPKNSKND